MKTIELKDYKVKIKEEDELTYNDVESIQKSAVGGMKFAKDGSVSGIDGSKMVDAKRLVAAVVIESISKDGEEVEFTQDWIGELPAKDGMKLMDAIEAETKDIVKKKKVVAK